MTDHLHLLNDLTDLDVLHICPRSLIRHMPMLIFVISVQEIKLKLFYLKNFAQANIQGL